MVDNWGRKTLDEVRVTIRESGLLLKVERERDERSD